VRGERALDESMPVVLRAELRHLTTFKPSARTPEMPVFAALATDLPVVIGTLLGHVNEGLVASLGFRAIWTKQLHRIAGTAVGMLATLGLLLFPMETRTLDGRAALCFRAHFHHAVDHLPRRGNAPWT